jgi:hypothetical protein
MNAMRRIWQLGLALAMLFTAQAFAVPIKPNLEKMLRQQQQQQVRPYEPARAGWDGPEAVPAKDASPNPVYEAYGPASTARAIRASLKAAAMPDPAAILGIGMLILLWRVARKQRSLDDQGNVAMMPIAVGSEEKKRAA